MPELYISSLVQYGINRGLIDPCDKIYITNRLLHALQLDSYVETAPADLPLEEILKGLLDDAVSRGVCNDDVTSRDLLDTELMGILTPPPPGGAQPVCSAVQPVARRGYPVVLSVLSGYRLYPPLPGGKGYALENVNRVR